MKKIKNMKKILVWFIFSLIYTPISSEKAQGKVYDSKSKLGAVQDAVGSPSGNNNWIY